MIQNKDFKFLCEPKSKKSLQKTSSRCVGMKSHKSLDEWSSQYVFTIPYSGSNAIWHVKLYGDWQKHQNTTHSAQRITRKFCTVEEWNCWKASPCLLLPQALSLSTSNLKTADGFLCRWGRPHSLPSPFHHSHCCLLPFVFLAVLSLRIMSLHLLVAFKGNLPNKLTYSICCTPFTVNHICCSSISLSPPSCCRRWDAVGVDAFVRWWFPVLLSGSRWSPCSEMSPGHGPTGRGKSTQLSLESKLVLSGKAGEQDKESYFPKATPPSPHSICQDLPAEASPP